MKEFGRSVMMIRMTALICGIALMSLFTGTFAAAAGSSGLSSSMSRKAASLPPASPDIERMKLDEKVRLPDLIAYAYEQNPAIRAAREA